MVKTLDVHNCGRHSDLQRIPTSQEDSNDSVHMVMNLRMFPDEMYNALIVRSQNLENEDTPGLMEQKIEISDKDTNSHKVNEQIIKPVMLVKTTDIKYSHSKPNNSSNTILNQLMQCEQAFIGNESSSVKDKKLCEEKHQECDNADGSESVSHEKNNEFLKTICCESSDTEYEKLSQSYAELEPEHRTRIEKSLRTASSSDINLTMCDVSSTVASHIKSKSIAMNDDTEKTKAAIILSTPAVSLADETLTLDLTASPQEISSDSKLKHNQDAYKKELCSINRLTNQDDKLFPCATCNIICPNLTGLLEHMKQHKARNQTPYMCHFCGKSFECAQNFSDHQLLDQCTPYKCDVCGMKFMLESNFYHHKKNAHKMCHICGKSFELARDLSNHQLMEHHPFFKCDICDTEFLKESNFNHHKDTAHKMCHLCGKIFKSANELSYHRLLDHRTIYKCDRCDMEFLKESNCNHHKENCPRRRRGAHMCKICDADLKTYERLYTHLNQHDELKTFVCEICGKGFVFQGQLNSHLRKHNKDKNYQCEECGKAIKSNEAFKKHQQRHKGIKPYMCDICGKKLASPEGYKSHVTAHKGPPPFMCDLCDKGYYTQGNLKNHKKEKHKINDDNSK